MADRGRLVLSVEDNPQNSMLVDKVLRGAGYRVVHAVDGPAALRAAGGERPDLVLLDIHLPGFDGFEALRRLRALPGLEKVPMLALTADVLRGDRNAILAGGFDDYLPKPYRIDELLAMVERHCPRAGREQAP
jgi:CheY-like chemotaxis protein